MHVVCWSGGSASFQFMADGMAVLMMAMPFSFFLLYLLIIFVLVLLAALLLLNATRTREQQGERNRRTRLGLWAMFCGPLGGALLAFLSNTLERFTHASPTAFKGRRCDHTFSHWSPSGVQVAGTAG